MTYTEKANIVYNETAEALRIVYNELNHGQQQKLMNNPKVKALYDKYGVVPNDK